MTFIYSPNHRRPQLSQPSSAPRRLKSLWVFCGLMLMLMGDVGLSEAATGAGADTPQAALTSDVEGDINGPSSENLGVFSWQPRLSPAQGSRRAWDARPYQVSVWICHRGQPELAAIESRLAAQIESSCELLDASSWFVTAGTPPGPIRNRLINTITNAKPDGAFERERLLNHYDKLMVVRLERVLGQTEIVVRECDLQTGQWGPVVERQSSNSAALGRQIADGVASAFMPLAKIDRVDTKDKVHVLPRATQMCVRVEFDNVDAPEIVPVTSSPVYIRKTDRFLPIIRKTDRSGNLKTLDPIEFTFLTIDSIGETELIASIHSRDRSALSQRKSKRAQKLALVIRPVQRPTVLHLESSGRDPRPLEGYEAWARKPSDTKADKSKFLGKTDWQGNVSIPPSDEGLRLIFIKRGARAYRKLPVIPGFKDRLVEQLRNDDARLFAEGVIRGYENEILNLITLRSLLESEIESLIGSNDFQSAQEKLLAYKNLETISNVKRRMSSEEVRLKTMANDPREFKQITDMFQTLKSLLNANLVKSREIQLQEMIQNKTLSDAKPNNGS